MDLETKIFYAQQHVAGLMRHDDEPLEVRRAAADALKQFINAELQEAESRETPERVQRRTADKELVAARDALEKAKLKARALAPRG